MSSISDSYVKRRFESVGYQDSSAKFVLDLFYPEGAKCVHCGSPITGKRSLATFWTGERTWCACCERKFSPRSGTPLENLHLSFAQFDFICLAMSLGARSKQIADIIGVSPETARSAIAKITYWETR